MKPKILANGLIINDGSRFIGCIIMSKGMITHVEIGRMNLDEISHEEYDVYDCSGKYILPGVIDEHVHFRDPGMTEKGDIYTESRAALAGGITSFFDMPNTLPPTTTIEEWEHKMQRAAKNSAANYAFFLGATSDNLNELLKADYTRIPGVKLFMGSSTGGMLLDDERALRDIFARLNCVIAVHAESENDIRQARECLEKEYSGGIPVGMHHMVRNRQACINATRHAIELARQYQTRLHLLHITTAEELDMLTPGNVTGKKITAETCPHYLFYSHDSVSNTAGRTKCNPAIKEDSDRRALLQAVATGRIDTIGTDHAPHLLSQKEGNALTAASGMPGVQYALPIMMQLAGKGFFTLEDVVEKMAHAPAQIFNVARRGYLLPGYMADIVVVNGDNEYTISDTDVISQCGWTPYDGIRLHYRVEQTWLNGTLAYDRGSFTGNSIALPVRFNP